MNWDLTAHFFSTQWNKSTATYLSVAYDCVPMESESDVVYEEEGKLLKADKTLLFKITDVSPAAEGEITFGGTVYKILHVSPDSAGKTIKVYLGARYGGG